MGYLHYSGLKLEPITDFTWRCKLKAVLLFLVFVLFFSPSFSLDLCIDGFKGLSPIM